MDKFDKSIKNAQKRYQPNSNFVEVTMKQINRRQPNKRWGYRFWAPALISGLAVLALIFVVLPLSSHKSNQTSSVSSTNSSKPLATNASGSIADGTDNASLTSDLNSIDGSMNQENADQNSANTALNDQSQEVTVPTN